MFDNVLKRLKKLVGNARPGGVKMLEDMRAELRELDREINENEDGLKAAIHAVQVHGADAPKAGALVEEFEQDLEALRKKRSRMAAAIDREEQLQAEAAAAAAKSKEEKRLADLASACVTARGLADDIEVNVIPALKAALDKYDAALAVVHRLAGTDWTHETAAAQHMARELVTVRAMGKVSMADYRPLADYVPSPDLGVPVRAGEGGVE